MSESIEDGMDSVYSPGILDHGWDTNWGELKLKTVCFLQIDLIFMKSDL